MVAVTNCKFIECLSKAEKRLQPVFKLMMLPRAARTVGVSAQATSTSVWCAP